METLDRDLSAGTMVRVHRRVPVMEQVVGTLTQDAHVGDRFIHVRPISGGEDRRFLLQQCSYFDVVKP